MGVIASSNETMAARCSSALASDFAAFTIMLRAKGCRRRVAPPRDPAPDGPAPAAWPPLRQRDAKQPSPDTVSRTPLPTKPSSRREMIGNATAVPAVRVTVRRGPARPLGAWRGGRRSSLDTSSQTPPPMTATGAEGSRATIAVPRSAPPVPLRAEGPAVITSVECTGR
jgi:hypothetical protein